MVGFDKVVEILIEVDSGWLVNFYSDKGSIPENFVDRVQAYYLKRFNEASVGIYVEEDSFGDGGLMVTVKVEDKMGELRVLDEAENPSYVDTSDACWAW